MKRFSLVNAKRLSELEMAAETYKKLLEKAPSKGKVYISTSYGRVVPQEELAVYRDDSAPEFVPIEKGSKQIHTEAEWMSFDSLIKHPFDTANLEAMFEKNPEYWKIPRQIATDVAGLGYALVLRDGHTEDAAEREKIVEFLRKPDGYNSIHELCKRCIIDWGVFGWFTIEVVRNLSREISEVHHVNSNSIWVHKDRNRYAQKVGQKVVWFNKFGASEDISSETGTRAGLTSSNIASELIIYREYFPGSSVYGAPLIIGSSGSVIGAICVSNYNLAFFSNYGIPAYFVILEGDWENDSDGETNVQEEIAKFLDVNCKDPNNAHKTMVFEVPEGGKVTVIPIGTTSKEGSFRLLLKGYSDDILMAYSMPPYRLGKAVIGSLGGDLAKDLTAVYEQSTIEPLQMVIETIFSDLIFEGMGFSRYRLRFSDMDTRDFDIEVERVTKLIRYGLMNRNDGRARLELGEPYPGGEEYLVDSSLVPVKYLLAQPVDKSMNIARSEFAKRAKDPVLASVLKVSEETLSSIYYGTESIELQKELVDHLDEPMYVSCGEQVHGVIVLESYEETDSVDNMGDADGESIAFCKYWYTYSPLDSPVRRIISPGDEDALIGKYLISRT